MPYELLAEKDVARFDNEVMHLRTHGFFINEDNVKSTTLKKKQTREEQKAITEKKDKEKLKLKEQKDKEKAAKDKEHAKAARSKSQSQSADKAKKTKLTQLKDKAVDKAASINAIDGYKLFVKTRYPGIFQKLADQNGSATHTEVMKIIGDNWNSLSQGTQRKYELTSIKLAEEDKVAKKGAKVAKQEVKPTKKRAKPDTPVVSEAQVKAKNSNKRVKKA